VLITSSLSPRVLVEQPTTNERICLFVCRALDFFSQTGHEFRYGKCLCECR
jgi:hypothetical protein